MKDNRGQALVEYILIITLITSVTAVSVLFLGGVIRDSITKVACQITNGNYVEGDKSGSASCDNN